MDVAILIILKDFNDDSYSFFMIGRDVAAGVSSVVHKPNIDIINLFRNDLTDIATRANTAAQNGFALEEFSDLGQLIYASILPTRVRTWLQATQGGALRIITNEPSIPWEIMHDRNEFIGIDRAIGRSVIMRREADRQLQSPQGRSPGAKLKALIIVDPTGDLPDSRKEATALITWLRDEMADEVDTPLALVGKEASRTRVCKGLVREPDIILYSGHITVSATGESGLLLADGQLGVQGIGNALRGEPLVLLMGCRSAGHIAKAGLAASDEGGRFSLPQEPSIAEHTQNMAEAFIWGGAKAVLGTLFEIPDDGAREFNEELFERLIGRRQPIGEAIRGAREEMRRKRPTDATWTSVVLYGDPSLTVLEAPSLDMRVWTQMLSGAGAEARLSGSGEIAEAHLFLALARTDAGVLRALLTERGVKDVAALVDKVRSPQAPLPANAQIRLSKEVERVGLALLTNAAGIGNPVTEDDVVRVFLQCGGEELLAKYGVAAQAAQPPQEEVRASALKSEKDLYDAPNDLALKRDCFSQEAWRALERAGRFAKGAMHYPVGTPHLLLGLAEHPSAIVRQILAQKGLTAECVQAAGRIYFPSGMHLTGVELAYTSVSENLRSVLKTAVEEAQRDASAPDRIEDRHLLLAILMAEGRADMLIAEAFRLCNPDGYNSFGRGA